MKYFLILLCALALAHGLNVKETILRNPFENDAEELLGPLMKEYFELKNLIEEIKQHQQTQKISSLVLAERIARVPPHCLPTDTPFIEARNSDACDNLRKSLAEAASLAKNISSWAQQAGLKLWEKFTEIFHCGNIDPVKAFKCIVQDFDDLKKMIQDYKPDALKFKEEIVAMAKKLKVEFKECFSGQKQAEAVAEQIVLQAQLCDDTKL